jgi:dUTP pyrophosphatase
MDLHIKILNDNCFEYYNNVIINDGDVGLDLVCPEDLFIEPYSKCFTIDLGIAVENLDNHYFDLRPRSSFSSSGLIMGCSIGTIDPSYRGSILAKVHNPWNEPVVIKKGMRLFQLVSPNYTKKITFKIVDELTETIRGIKGHGSTGGSIQ